jgi:methyl-accepting chemotaxis protein
MDKKTKTRKSKQNNKNKKLLKKMMNNSKSNNDNSSLENNIQILIGGEMVEPSQFDKIIFGYANSMDMSSPFDKLWNNIGKSTSNYIAVIQGLMARNVLSAIDMKGKTPEQVAEELKNDAKTIEQINDYFDTNEGKQALNEIQELSNEVGGVISKSIEQLPEELDESIDKLAEKTVDAGVSAMTEVPGVNVIVGTTGLINSIEGAVGEIAEASGKVANLVGDASEEIKKPIEEINDKIDEISDEVNEMPQLPQTQFSEDESPITNDNQQFGGSNVNKFNHTFHNGGKKIRKRIHSTRHAFKNISKNITRKK